MYAQETRIAHLSDAHMLDTRPGRSRSNRSMRNRFLSLGRPLNGIERRRKLGEALCAARQAGAARVVISGDLTEIGAAGEFESLAEVLHESPFAPERITLVPGNHDLYSSADGWQWALNGPLAAFGPTSAKQPGHVVECYGYNLLPMDVTFHQAVTRSAGVIQPEMLSELERRASDRALAGVPLVVVQHHPPFVRKTRALHWVDGLIGAARLMALLEKFRHLFVLHGHLHAVVNRVVGLGVTRVFGTTAVVDDQDGPRVRVFDAINGCLEAAGLRPG